MPQHKSCIKRIQTSERARISNRAYRSQLKSIVRQVEQASSKAQAEESLRKATSLIDHLTRKGIFHRNKCANLKSRLTKRVNALQA